MYYNRFYTAGIENLAESISKGYLPGYVYPFCARGFIVADLRHLTKGSAYHTGKRIYIVAGWQRALFQTHFQRLTYPLLSDHRFVDD